jgi:hypothetical protein
MPIRDVGLIGTGSEQRERLPSCAFSSVGDSNVQPAPRDAGMADALRARPSKLYAGWIGDVGKNVFYSTLSGTTWSAQTTIPSTDFGDPGAAFAVYNGLLYASFGESATDAIWHATFNGSTWSVPVTITSQYQCCNGPALAVNKKVLYDVWQDYTTSDDMIASFNGTTWNTESTLPSGQSSGGPALGAYKGRLYHAWVAPTGSGAIEYSTEP